jgi:hypothetical protein
VPRTLRIPRFGGTMRSIPTLPEASMTRLGLLYPVALILASGCASIRCGETDTAPTHTFGKDGVVERNGGLLGGKREFCPRCEYLGTKCAACLAKEREAAECAKCKANGTEHTKRKSADDCKCHADVKDTASIPSHDADARASAEKLILSLETKKIPPEPVADKAPAQLVKKSTSKKAKSGEKQTDEPDEGDHSTKLVSPYAPVRNAGQLRTSRKPGDE